MVLLYIDLLGMKSRWQNGGVAGAKAAYQTLDLVIRHVLEAVPVPLAERTSGTIQSDAAAIVCRDSSDAVTLGRLVFREVFRRSGSLEAGRERHWVRGVIVEMSETDLESKDELPGAAHNVSRRIFSDDLLEAINIEQSGYRGQRLLVAESLIGPELEGQFQIDIGGGQFFYPIATLTYSSRRPGFRDVLWMFPERGAPDELGAQWELMRIAMDNRLRWAGEGGVGEFTHAAATQLLFVECNTIYRDLMDGGAS